MNKIITGLITAGLRHYKDPSSWAALVTSIFVAFNASKPNPEIVGYVDVILGGIMSILLFFIDGRKNPNTSAEGKISERTPVGTVPLVAPASSVDVAAVVVPAHAIPSESEIVVVPSGRKSGDVPTDTGHRAGFGKY